MDLHAEEMRLEAARERIAAEYDDVLKRINEHGSNPRLDAEQQRLQGEMTSTVQRLRRVKQVESDLSAAIQNYGATLYPHGIRVGTEVPPPSFSISDDASTITVRCARSGESETFSTGGSAGIGETGAHRAGRLLALKTLASI